MTSRRPSDEGWFALALLTCTPLANGADIAFHGGAIFTAHGTRAEVVTVSGGAITYVGNAIDATAHYGEGTRHVDIGDGLLLPGFIDAHVHPVGVGLGLTLQCDVSGIGDAARILARIRECANARDDDPW